LNPEVEDMDQLRTNPEQRLDLVVAGTKDAVMMVESEAYELTEDEMLGAVNFAHEQIQPVIDLIIELAEDAANEPFDFKAPDYSDLYNAIKKAGEKSMRSAFSLKDKQERVAAVSEARESIRSSLNEEQIEDPNLGSAMKKTRSFDIERGCRKNRQTYRWKKDH
jgi:polyribonucleotide nucleotidyltransferase